MKPAPHGGARKGAGRKPSQDARRPYYVRLSASEVAQALRLGGTVSEGVQRALLSPPLLSHLVP
jgi:hypothetical protein